jgi:hypothetical protein
MSGGRFVRADGSPRHMVLIEAQMSVDNVSRAPRAPSRAAVIAAAIELGESTLCASRSRIVHRLMDPA